MRISATATTAVLVSLVGLDAILSLQVSAFTLMPTTCTRNYSVQSRTGLHVAEQISAPLETNLDDNVNEDANDETDANSHSSVVAVTPPTTPARKYNRHKHRKPNEDVKFLLKRTRQILAKQPLSKKAKVDIRTVHWLIDAWAESHHINAPEQALALYNAIQEYPDTIPHGPTIKTLTKVLHVFAKSGRGGDAAKAILEEYTTADDDATMKPNVYTYTAILEAYACTSNPPPSYANACAAQNLCDWMENEHDANLEPNARSYGAVIRAWGYSGVDEGALKAEECLHRMERLHAEKDATSDTRPRPNVWNYNMVLNAWANSGMVDNAERAEELLNNMEKGQNGVRPNAVSYNACIDAWAKNGSGKRAEAILRQMEELYISGKNDGCKPNTRSYNSVINAYAKSSEKSGAQKAENILHEMQNLYKQEIHKAGDEGKSKSVVKPDLVSFASVINAWGRSFQYGKAEKVMRLYREIIEQFEKGDTSMRPNVVLFNTIINACAYTIGEPSEQKQAMEIAHGMFQELLKSDYGSPDQITYGTFIKVCNNEMPNNDARHQLVSAIFRKCAKDGQVGQLVLDQMKAVASDSQFKELLGGDIFAPSLDDLPEEWKRNVVEGRRYRRQKLF